MPYATPISIVPKFMWNYISMYLDKSCLLKLILVNNTFSTTIDDQIWKQSFYNRIENIAIVQTKSQRIKNFWSYACRTYTSCINIHDLFLSVTGPKRRIRRPNNTGSMLYYKIFIKDGHYEFNNDNSYYNNNDIDEIYGYHFNRTNIELNGDPSNPTVITDYNPYNNTILSLNNLQYFEMRHIKLCNVVLYINKNYTDYTYNYHNIVHISNCIFSNNGTIADGVTNRWKSHLRNENNYITINSVNVIIVANSIFNNIGLHIDLDSKSTNTIDYSVMGNIFRNCNNGSFILLNGSCDNQSAISICDNTIKNGFNMLSNNITNSTAIVSGNIISNMDICLSVDDNCKIIFTENKLTDIVKLTCNNESLVETDNNKYYRCVWQNN